MSKEIPLHVDIVIDLEDFSQAILKQYDEGMISALVQDLNIELNSPTFTEKMYKYFKKEYEKV